MSDMDSPPQMPGKKVVLTNTDLAKIPDPDRKLLLGMWHATNELNCLMKLVVIANKTTAENEIELAGRAINEVFLLRVFATKIFEAYKYFKKASHFAGFKSIYLENTRQPGRCARLEKAKTTLGKYFGKGTNALEVLRNNLGAHYHPSYFELRTDDERLDSFIYLGEQAGNSIYFVSEEVAFKRLTSELRLNLQETIAYLIDEAIEMANTLLELSTNISIICLSEYLPPGIVTSAPWMNMPLAASSQLQFPFFIDFRPSSNRTSE
jgi:hypothetical protein